MVSSDFQWGAPNGQTKIFGVRSTTGNSKLWFNFYFGLENIISAENTPADGSTTNIGVNMSQPREQWTCIEWHFIANTPGVPNGTLQMWKNGTQTIFETMFSGVGPRIPRHGILCAYIDSQGSATYGLIALPLGTLGLGVLALPLLPDATS